MLNLLLNLLGKKKKAPVNTPTEYNSPTSGEIYAYLVKHKKLDEEKKAKEITYWHNIGNERWLKIGKKEFERVGRVAITHNENVLLLIQVGVGSHGFLITPKTSPKRKYKWVGNSRIEIKPLINAQER